MFNDQCSKIFNIKKNASEISVKKSSDAFVIIYSSKLNGN